MASSTHDADVALKSRTNVQFCVQQGFYREIQIEYRTFFLFFKYFLFFLFFLYFLFFCVQNLELHFFGSSELNENFYIFYFFGKGSSQGLLPVRRIIQGTSFFLCIYRQNALFRNFLPRKDAVLGYYERTEWFQNPSSRCTQTRIYCRGLAF